MVPTELQRLHAVFSDTRNWVERRRQETTDARDLAFLQILGEYVSQSLRRLAAKPGRKELARLRDRSEKVHAAIILYMQQHS